MAPASSEARLPCTTPTFSTCAALHPRRGGHAHAIIDRERLQANARQVVHNINGRMQLRLVNKSLPSLALLDELVCLTGTTRQMVFNLPLPAIADQRAAALRRATGQTLACCCCRTLLCSASHLRL